MVCPPEQVGKTDDRIQRCSDLVTHVGQKLALGLIRGVGEPGEPQGIVKGFTEQGVRLLQLIRLFFQGDHQVGKLGQRRVKYEEKLQEEDRQTGGEDQFFKEKKRLDTFLCLAVEEKGNPVHEL